ncbi:uncharacterized protein BYT42DRAFT_586494 [Radiomyces spectabilis]|uniref:uncharacterized protein n=1 Tax=Radiomyces spectabilis TaxID=64574 RepID=UPI00221F4DFB|nr:uncharacterized protein BYT42DRAFT_586494 [Radiomyces spectabilis]KAI8367498.1 hypothetical protein BYT42DRAFT_586494 [Radiomyces spectabilis]
MATKLFEIQRTGTFAWSPSPTIPAMAVASPSHRQSDAAVQSAVIELFYLPPFPSKSYSQTLSAQGTVTCLSRISTVEWGHVTASRPHGILASGTISGELLLWDATLILEEQRSSRDALIIRTRKHAGHLRSLCFNRHQPNLLATAGEYGEMFIWDLTNPNKPYTPNNRISKQTHIVRAAWNNQVQHIIATSCSHGDTMVWDLRAKKEVMVISSPIKNNTVKSVNALAWHPDKAAQLATTYDDDQYPSIYLWDLRHANSYIIALSGHRESVLDLAWCDQDANLLLSASKDGRIAAWSTDASEYLGDLSKSTEPISQIHFRPYDPRLLASADQSGKIDIYSMGSTYKRSTISCHAKDERQYTNDNKRSLLLREPPKWLRRPTGASFGFGGKLVIFRNSNQAKESRQSPRQVVIQAVRNNSLLMAEAEAVNAATKKDTIQLIIQQRYSTSIDENAVMNEWELFRILTAQDSRTQLLKYLDYDSSQVTSSIASLFKDLPSKDKQENEPAAALDHTSPTAFKSVIPTSIGSLSQLFPHLPTEPPFPTAASLTKVEPLTTQQLSFFSTHTSATDQVITRALITGDFLSAVNTCLVNDNLADALAIAYYGGEDLFISTLQQHFQRRSTKKPYLQLLHSLADDDLAFIAYHIAIDEWKAAMAVFCTFAKPEHFASLCDLLGKRLEQTMVDNLSNHDQHYGYYALLCYIVAGSFENCVRLWLLLQQQNGSKDASAELHRLVQKCIIFSKVLDYEDPAFNRDSDSGSDHSLDGLYEIYSGYAKFLASEGRLDIAWSYLQRIPPTCSSALHTDVLMMQDRIYRAMAGVNRNDDQLFPLTHVSLSTEVFTSAKSNDATLQIHKTDKIKDNKQYTADSLTITSWKPLHKAEPLYDPLTTAEHTPSDEQQVLAKAFDNGDDVFEGFVYNTSPSNELESKVASKLVVSRPHQKLEREPSLSNIPSAVPSSSDTPLPTPWAVSTQPLDQYDMYNSPSPSPSLAITAVPISSPSPLDNLWADENHSHDFIEFHDASPLIHQDAKLQGFTQQPNYTFMYDQQQLETDYIKQVPRKKEQAQRFVYERNHLSATQRPIYDVLSHILRQTRQQLPVRAIT